MRGLLFDIGGVFLVPDRGRIVQALGDPMEGLSDTAFDRAHFEGMHALDVTNASGDEEQRVYLDGYLTSLGIPGADREATIDAIRPLWSEPSPDLWQRILSGSISGLRSLGDANLSLGMVSNSDGHAEEALVRNGIARWDQDLACRLLPSSTPLSLGSRNQTRPFSTLRFLPSPWTPLR